MWLEVSRRFFVITNSGSTINSVLKNDNSPASGPEKWAINDYRRGAINTIIFAEFILNLE